MVPERSGLACSPPRLRRLRRVVRGGDAAALIERLRPDVLVKGDYARAAIVGRIRWKGGRRVVRVPLVPGASTTP